MMTILSPNQFFALEGYPHSLLFEVFKRGYGSVSLIQNVPYTKNGKFAFIDTEYPRRVLDLRKVKKFLPADMQRYWDSLIGG